MDGTAHFFSLQIWILLLSSNPDSLLHSSMPSYQPPLLYSLPPRYSTHTIPITSLYPSPISPPRSLDVLSLIAKVLFLTDEQLEVVGLKVPSKNIFTTIISSFTPVEPKIASDIEVSKEPCLCLLLCLSVPYFNVII